MGDKQNHKIMSILRHQHLRRIALRLFTKKCISYLGFVTVPPSEKSPQVLLAFFEICLKLYCLISFVIASLKTVVLKQPR